MRITAINPTTMQTIPGLSRAILVDNQLFISGVVPVDCDNTLVGPGDAKAQAAKCLELIQSVLQEAGGSFADIVRLTCFATSTEAAAAYVAAKRPLLGIPPPASTTVIVERLIRDGVLLEVEAFALLGRSECQQL